MNRGIVILAFGKRGYGFAAWNLAKSIRHFSPGLKITLFYDNEAIKQVQDRSVWDNMVELSTEITHTNGKIDPAKTKVNLYNITPYKETLYIDADCIVLKGITPLFDELIKQDGYYLTTVVDKGGRNDTIHYSAWASNESIWNHFKLKEDAVLPSIQSSYAYFKKCKEADKFFKTVVKNFNFPIKDLKIKWGGGLPDELIFSGTCAQFGLIPKANDAVFFGNSREVIAESKIVEDHYFLTLYGSGKGNKTVKLRYVEWYDRLMKKICRHEFKSNYILNDKHVDNHGKN